jgi:membrane protease YdiL (CAAX protease family)
VEGEDGVSARRAAVWALALAGAVVLAVLVSGPLHVWLAERGWRRADEFASTLRRVLVVAIVLAIALVARPWRTAPRDAWGLWGGRARPLHLPLGVLLAAAAMAAVVATQFAAGWFEWDRHGARRLGHRWLGAVPAALAIGLLEEVFFRGFVLDAVARGLRATRGRRLLLAAVLASLLYAVPHGFKGSAAPRGLSPDVPGALEALRAWFLSVSDLSSFGPKLVGFTAFGLLLCAARLRTGGLWLGVGLHAGAVLFLTFLGALADRDPERNWAGTKFLHDGPIAWAVVLALAFALWPRGRREPLSSGASPAGRTTA